MLCSKKHMRCPPSPLARAKAMPAWRSTSRRGVAVGRRERDADAGGDEHLLADHLERPAQGLDQAVHEGHDVAKIGDVDEGDGEFVAAQPRDEVALAQRRPNAGADVPQHLIAAAVIDGFVDLLELVDVEAEHRDMVPSRCMRAMASASRSLKDLRLERPVRASCSSR